jgi:hypothetical protein
MFAKRIDDNTTEEFHQIEGGNSIDVDVDADKDTSGSVKNTRSDFPSLRFQQSGFEQYYNEETPVDERSRVNTRRPSAAVPPPPESETDERYAPLDLKTSRVFGMVAMTAALTALLLIVLACFKYDEGLLREMRDNRYHYSLNISGYVCFIHAVITYRSYGFKFYIKRAIHATSHVCCICLISAGIGIKAYCHTYHRESHPYKINLFSFHSFIATATMLIYVLQFLSVSIVSQYIFKKPPHVLTLAKSMHRELGMFLMTALTAVVSAGIQQLFSLSACAPAPLTDPNTNPAATYGSMPLACQMINGAGLLIYVAALFATLCVSGLRFGNMMQVLANV